MWSTCRECNQMNLVYSVLDWLLSPSPKGGGQISCHMTILHDSGDDTSSLYFDSLSIRFDSAPTDAHKSPCDTHRSPCDTHRSQFVCFPNFHCLVYNVYMGLLQLVFLGMNSRQAFFFNFVKTKTHKSLK